MRRETATHMFLAWQAKIHLKLSKNGVRSTAPSSTTNKKPGHLSMHRAGGLLNYERDLSHSSPRQPQLHVGGKTLDRNGRIKLAQGPWLQPACCAVNTLPAERKRLRSHALAGRDSVAGYLIVQKHV